MSGQTVSRAVRRSVGLENGASPVSGPAATRFAAVERGTPLKRGQGRLE